MNLSDSDSQKMTLLSSALVSVICPVYNAEAYLQATIQSVMAQTYPHWELLLIIDAKSKDKSLELAYQWAKEDIRIQVLESPAHLGVANNRNHGIQKARGAWIAFLDSDDIWLSQKLEKQILFMNEKSSNFSFHSYQSINADGTLLPRIRQAPSYVTYHDLLKSNVIGCLTVMVKTSLIKQFSFKTNRPHEDFLLWLEILKTIPQAHGLSEVLAHYRILPNSRSGNKKQAAQDRWFLYRDELKLSVARSLYYFLHYAFTALLQRWNGK